MQKSSHTMKQNTTMQLAPFEHPTEGTLYQFQLIVIFQEGSLCNGFPFEDGFKVKIKPPKPSGPGGNSSRDATHVQPLQSWKYLSGNQYRGQPGQEKKKRTQPSRKNRRKAKQQDS